MTKFDKQAGILIVICAAIFVFSLVSSLALIVRSSWHALYFIAFMALSFLVIRFFWITCDEEQCK
jgi:hypothetical protein